MEVEIIAVTEKEIIKILACKDIDALDLLLEQSARAKKRERKIRCQPLLRVINQARFYAELTLSVQESEHRVLKRRNIR